MATSEQQATQAALAAGADPQNLAWARRMLGSQEYINLCQRFVENALGTQGQFPSAIAAWEGQAGQTDLSQMRPGDTIYFSANEGNQGYGHAGIYAGNGMFINPSPNGVEETDISDWMQRTGQQILGFVPQGNRRAPGLSSPMPDEDTFGDPFGLGLSEEDMAALLGQDTSTPPTDQNAGFDFGNMLRGANPYWASVWDSIFNRPQVASETPTPSTTVQSDLFSDTWFAERLQKLQDDLSIGTITASQYQTQINALNKIRTQLQSQQGGRARGLSNFLASMFGAPTAPGGKYKAPSSDTAQGNLQQRIAEFNYRKAQDAANRLRQEGKDQEALYQDMLAEQWKQRTFAYQQQKDKAQAAMDYAEFGVKRQERERANRALFSTRGEQAAPETSLPDFQSFWESMSGDPYSSGNFLEHLKRIGSGLQSPDFSAQWNAWRNQNLGGLQPSVRPMEESPWFKGMRGQGLKTWRPPPGVGMPNLNALSQFSEGEMTDYNKFLNTAGININDIFNAIKRRMPQRAAPRGWWGSA